MTQFGVSHVGVIEKIMELGGQLDGELGGHIDGDNLEDNHGSRLT